MLTGKTKIEFQDWFHNDGIDNWKTLQDDNNESMKKFYSLPLSMKYGVYVDFFDSVNIRVDVMSAWEESKKGDPMLIYVVYLRGEIHSPWAGRVDARKAAIDEANEIFNSTK